MNAAKKATSEKVTKQAEAAVSVGKESIEAAVKASTEAVTMAFERTSAVTKEQFDAAFKACDTAFKDVAGYKDISAFGRENVDAAIKSGAAFIKGFQDFGKAWTTMAQSSMENGLAAASSMIGCKNLPELAEFQAELVKKNYHEGVADSRALTGLSVKIAEEAFFPLRARVDAAVETFAKSPSA